MLSILQRAVTLKGKLEYYIPITGNSSLLTVPRVFATAVFSRTSSSLLFLWAALLFPSSSPFYGCFWQPWILKSTQLCQIQVYWVPTFTFKRKLPWVSSQWKAVLACCGLHFEMLLLMFLLLPTNGHLTGTSGPVLKVSE